MPVKNMIFILLAATSLCMYSANSLAQSSPEEQHIQVTMRMIGHQLLLSSGDSTSRVMPVVKNENNYSLMFESEIGFVPEALVATIDTIIGKSGIADSYIVEVVTCDSSRVVYSYEKQLIENNSIVPCQSREILKGCYRINMTLLNGENYGSEFSNEEASPQGALSNPINVLLIAAGIGLIALGIFFYRKKKNKASQSDPDIIPLGDSRFNKRNTELVIKDQKIELTSKEAELLILLYDSVNTTVEREVILNMVWGDNGDYVGRTLDVFISKLRKKLEADSKVKIVNIRGVGYKLVTNA